MLRRMSDLPNLDSYLAGRWQRGEGTPELLLDPATERGLAELRPQGLEVAAALAHARSVGGPALAGLGFAARGALLAEMSKLFIARRDELLGLGMDNGGQTRGDAKFDVDGAIGTLATYAELGKSLGDGQLLPDGELIQLGRSARLFGGHALGPRAGVAVHINAFNFPAWGTFEKVACALLAGMPVISKPATATALVAHRMVQLVVEARLLPEGALQLIAGSVGDLLARLGGQDVLAFTGSGATGALLRGHPNVVARNVRINVEADSLNAAVLGPDVEVGSPTWDMFVAEVVKDMTQKTGQKCTAIRRILVPEALRGPVEEILVERLAAIKVGATSHPDVGMGPLATARQQADVRAGLARLAEEASVLSGGDGTVKTPLGAPPGKGFFVAPVLMRARDSASARVVHELEVFGPAATILAYDGSADRAAELVRRAEGSLVSSVYADDRAFLARLVKGMASHLGRIYLGSAKVAGQTFGPGTVLPTLIHGGPGRAGGGEELGGLRGLGFYMQRTALSGDRALLESILGAREG
jgi:oxepin-CoA hydrolase/3-oxo-5,6-dehydrosuberyl-CoA semialdehyde dehydrogenase